MKKLIIDLDDVICEGGFFTLINKFLNSNYTLSDVKGYYMQSLIDDSKLDEFFEFLLESNMYNYVEVIPNAIEVIEKLNDKYELYICSSFIIPSCEKNLGKLIKDKCDWIKENMPFIKFSQMIFTSEKHLIDADIRIDDSIKNLYGKSDMKLLFTSYHNTNFKDDELAKEGIKRVDNWIEIEKLLLK